MMSFSIKSRCSKSALKEGVGSHRSNHGLLEESGVGISQRQRLVAQPWSSASLIEHKAYVYRSCFSAIKNPGPLRSKWFSNFGFFSFGFGTRRGTKGRYFEHPILSRQLPLQAGLVSVQNAHHVFQRKAGQNTFLIHSEDIREHRSVITVGL